MAKLIGESTSEDLRQDSWKMKNYRYEGNKLVQRYTNQDGKELEVKTRLAGYDDAFGNAVILHQEIYDMEVTDEK